MSETLIIDADALDAAGVRRVEFVKVKVESDCDHPFRVTGDVCLNCGEWDKDGAIARIRELEARLADLRDLAYNRAPKIAAEEANKQTAELRAQLADAQRMYQLVASERTVELVDELKAQLAEFKRRLDEDSALLSKDDLVATLIERAEQAGAQLAEAKTDIEELTFCEECEESAAKLESNGCYPPRYCHGCYHGLAAQLAETKAELRDWIENRGPKLAADVANAQAADLASENAKLRDANARLHADVEAYEGAVDRLRAALKSLCFDARQVLTLGAPEYQQGFRELQERIEKCEALSRQEGDTK